MNTIKREKNTKFRWYLYIIWIDLILTIKVGEQQWGHQYALIPEFCRWNYFRCFCKQRRITESMNEFSLLIYIQVFCQMFNVFFLQPSSYNFFHYKCCKIRKTHTLCFFYKKIFQFIPWLKLPQQKNCINPNFIAVKTIRDRTVLPEKFEAPMSVWITLWNLKFN